MMTRRDFLAASSAVVIAPMGLAAMPSDDLPPPLEQDPIAEGVIDWSYGMKPLFCSAYIDPGFESQRHQEHHVAKFPIALVPQDNRRHFRDWRKKVRDLNPNIKLLAYQMVIEETSVPGPGHKVLGRLADSWVTYPGGIVPTVTFQTNVSGRKRIYDPRSVAWQEAFLESCNAVLDSDEYDGLFLDQCTVYDKAALTAVTKSEMLEALDSTLLRLRALLPSELIIGNSSYFWQALNGEMNENRPVSMPKEIAIDSRRKEPRLELFQYYSKVGEPETELKRMFKLAIKNRAFFGCTVNPQTVRWLDFYDEILGDYSIKT